MKGKDNVVVGENGKATGTATINGERVGGITTTTARQPDKITPFPKRIIEAITEIVELRRQYSFDKENKVRGIKCPRQAEMVVDNVASATEESCLICMENKKCVLALPCSHVISCVACSREYLEKSQGHATCPKCRTVVSELKLIYL